MDPRMWKIMGKRLGFNDEEMEVFKSNPRNQRVISKAQELFNTHFVAEVVEARGCNSRHKKGDKIYLDGHGNLVGNQNPEKLCIFAVGSLMPLIFAAQELVYAGVDPNTMCFNTADCVDVGLACGGWGKVVMKLTAERNEEP